MKKSKIKLIVKVTLLSMMFSLIHLLCHVAMRENINGIFYGELFNSPEGLSIKMSKHILDC